MAFIMLSYVPYIYIHTHTHKHTHTHTHIYIERETIFSLYTQPVNRHLGCFHVLAIVNSAAMNIGMHVSF